MTLSTMTALLLVFTLSLLSAPQPLFFGLIMLIIAPLLAVLIALHYSSWYAYTFFIIFVGGLLVMFAYVSALVPNSLFHTTPLKNGLKLLLLWVPLLYYLLLLPSSSSHHSLHLLQYTIFKSGNDLYTPSNYPLLMLLIIILLLILTLVVKISSQTTGPLRPFL
uniref:NADH dehydrogenase subunit 6 n=1 Tax=Phyllochaetopterus sp. AW-2015 TaxID=1750699 RepID=A0A0S2N0E8_9ANNE|nr:NADH dehydrogenase subunit 6 [Phyllochaetopterus sp. AW-2015]